MTLLRQTKQPTGKGGFTTGWQDVATVRAHVVALTGRESLVDHVLQGIAVYRITIVWRGDITPKDQIRLDDGRILNIRLADDIDGRRRDLVIVAGTVAATGA
ncbi:phage head closure protein [Sphingomonas sp. IW22]|uniref:phage head closure protein n=1 Tax=Sphingomonas sp. IW22 TaxID=3242489 RepID=UPI00352265F4